MNDRDALRLAARRASLYSAVRSGDAILAARAAARMRVPAAGLSAAEMLRAREARRTLGRAIVKARLPKPEAQPLVTGVAITAPLPGSRKRALLAALTVLALLLLLIDSGGSSGSPSSADEAQPEQQEQPQVVAERIVQQSRGRTVALPPLIVAEAPPTATPEPTAEPTPQPTAASTATPGTAIVLRTSSPGPTGSGTGAGGTGGTGAGGSGGGSGTGSGGSGGGSGGGTGFPTPQPLPPVPPPGFGRFSIVVYDAVSGRPVPGACVVIGSPNCDPSAPHTDINGRWAIDIPATTATTYWDLYFSKPGYVFERRQLGLAAGRTVTFTIFLRRTR